MSHSSEDNAPALCGRGNLVPVPQNYGWQQRCDGCGSTRHVQLLKVIGTATLDDLNRRPQIPMFGMRRNDLVHDRAGP